MDRDVDGAVRRKLDAGDFEGATSIALRAFGPEVLGLLVALHRDYDAACDAFSVFAERLWLSFQRFEGRSSVRTWTYAIARNASVDARRREGRQGRRMKPLSDAPEIERLAAAVRTETLTILRTETKSRLAELRESLPEDDQLLLVLRVDRKLSWEELALVFRGEGATAEERKRESARLRKRFQFVKERLRELAIANGVLEQ